MAKEYFMDEVAVLKKIVQEAGRMREYSENEMSDLIDHKIQERIEWARQNDEGLYWYYQNLSFKDKKTLKYTVTESVEGLGILGKIIMDPDITEVMINGYDTIFVEKSGKLMQLEEHFESSEDLERIVKRFVSSMDRTVDASNPIVDARLSSSAGCVKWGNRHDPTVLEESDDDRKTSFLWIYHPRSSGLSGKSCGDQTQCVCMRRNRKW